MDEIVERVENNFINIYNKFNILDKKLNNYHIKIDEINEMTDIIISDEYTKIHGLLNTRPYMSHLRGQN